MTVRIAHISDVHWERLDVGVSDRLTRALQNEQPNVLVFTGDLVDNPWKIKSAKPWLMELCKACRLDPATHLLLVPGNHDYRVIGNFGWRPLSGWLFFRRHFRDWMKRRVRYFPELRVAFFRIDSNPWLVGFARGRVGRIELGRLRKEWDSAPPKEREQIETSLKIALIHHHPVPIPYAGSDAFLLLKDAQRVLQFVAEKKIGMMLHGHKHHAPYSLLCLRSPVASDRIIEILGAGAAVLNDTDHDPRGHNFNLICLEENGLRYVRQFFARPNEDFRELANPGYPIQSFEEAFERALVKGYRYRTVHWSMEIDIQGDRFNELVYTGVMPAEGKSLPFIRPPAYSVETGHISPVWLNQAKSSSGVSLKPLKEESRRAEFQVNFTPPPTEQAPVHYVLESYDYNACSMNLDEFRRKYRDRDPVREWEEKSIQEPVEDFSWTIRFPAELAFAKPPEFEVVDSVSSERHEWLTRILQPNFWYSEPLRTASLAIHKPPTGYYYRVSWFIGPGASVTRPIDPKHQIVVDDFRRRLLEIPPAVLEKTVRPAIHLPLQSVLETFAQLVEKKLTDELGKPGLIAAKNLDVSLMVYDQTGKLPLLRIVGCIGPGANRYWNFTLEVGDGNAGRAFKKNIIRWWDLARPGDRRQTYVKDRNAPGHPILYSMPMRHPESQELIYGILNLGAFTEAEAAPLRLLNHEAGYEWLLKQAQGYVLQRLMKIV